MTANAELASYTADEMLTVAASRELADGLKPAPVSAPKAAPQAPHVNVLVFARGLLKQVATRLYFPDEEEANAADPVLSPIQDRTRRETLVARDEGGGSYRFDVRLQGEGQTAFFEV